MPESFDLWAKTGPAPTIWHSLPFHLLDVAACAEELWDRLPLDSCSQLAESLNLDETQTKAMVCFLAASHDVGKGNPYFQAKAADHRERLKDWGLHASSEPKGHGQATTALLSEWLGERWGWDQWGAAVVGVSVGGHHGIFDHDTKLSTLEVKADPWHKAAFELLDSLAEVIGVLPTQIPEASLTHFALFLAGFVCVADWLGSNEGMVTYQSEPCPLRDYLEGSRARARHLLDMVGFRSQSVSQPLTITDLLPPGAAANEMQRAVEHLAGQPFRFVLIEAPTGEGKTEAALRLAEVGRAAGRGFFFALPTMATANGLLARIDGYLQTAIGSHEERARLLHSGAWLVRREGDTLANPDDREKGPEAEDWFAGSKRGLLDRYGVGTIDQALMGALLAKHFFVRLFALSGKTVVVDEVHAYDVYMASLMDILLAWLKVLDCRVILLSATLPSARRRSLLASWGCAESPETPYPRITAVLADGTAQAESFSVKARRPLKIQPMLCGQDTSLEEAVGMLLKSIRQGAKTAALIVNTVSRAQKAMAAASQLLESREIEVSLFHARLTIEDRQTVESKVLMEFGKEAPRDRPRLLIATQVVEQSLDLDFDLMVSDLAPVDLLIQRAGRLHRHTRDANCALQPPGVPDQRPDPVLHVILESSGDRDLGPVKDIVYSAAVLRETQAWLDDGQIIAGPQDVEGAVEAVYGRLDQADLEAEADAQMKAALQSLKLKEAKQTMIASASSIKLPDPEDPMPAVNRLIESEEGPRHGLAAKTRLETLPSISLIIWPHGLDLPRAPLSQEDKRTLADKQIRVTAHGGIISDLLDLPQGEGWSRVRALSDSRLAQLDASGGFETATYKFHYSLHTGLYWETKHA